MGLGSIVAPLASPASQAKRGTALASSKLSLLRRLTETVKGTLTGKNKRRYLYGLDGRKLNVCSSHSALNTLLQSAGAVLMKKATVIFHQEADERGWVLGKDYVQVLHVHDEFQITTRPERADEIGALIVHSIELAGQHCKLRCPTTGEYKVGKNWAETH